MELLKAIEKMNRLDSDVNKLGNWIAHLEFNEKPVTGKSWVKLEKAIRGVMEDLIDERDNLEVKIKEVADGIEVDHQ